MPDAQQRAKQIKQQTKTKAQQAAMSANPDTNHAERQMYGRGEYRGKGPQPFHANGRGNRNH